MVNQRTTNTTELEVIVFAKIIRKCKKCAKCPSWLQEIKSAVNLYEHATWYQWEHIEQMLQAKRGKSMKRVKKIQKVLKEGTVDDALEGLEVQLPPFLEHVFIKQQQARFFQRQVGTSDRRRSNGAG